MSSVIAFRAVITCVCFCQILEHFGANDGDASESSKKATNVLKGLRERRNSRKPKPAPPVSVKATPRQLGSGEDPGSGDEKDGEGQSSARDGMKEGEEKS